MTHELRLDNMTDKSQIYPSLITQIEHLIEGEEDLIANLANISAALKEGLGFLWVGFYLVRGEELVLGPFQGPVACTRITFGRGVCGAAWEQGRTIIVEDVEKFPGHIACSSHSKSEIVVPVFNGKEVVMVLDIDSDKIGNFDTEDELHLNVLARLIQKIINP